jgi:hypothetical protein
VAVSISSQEVLDERAHFGNAQARHDALDVGDGQWAVQSTDRSYHPEHGFGELGERGLRSELVRRERLPELPLDLVRNSSASIGIGFLARDDVRNRFASVRSVSEIDLPLASRRSCRRVAAAVGAP